MDWLTFLTHIISSTAWPVAIVIIVFSLRNYIGKLIPFTKKVKYGDLEIEFGQELESIKKDIEAQRKSHPIAIEQRPEQSELDSEIKSTFDISPRAALVDAWVNLELSAISSARMLKMIPQDATVSFVNVIRALQKAGVIGNQDARILYRLRMLRNEALHSPHFQISEEEALEFIRLTREQADLIVAEAYQKQGGCGN